MKRAIILLLILCVAVSLPACGQSYGKTDVPVSTEKVFENGKVENGLTFHKLSALPGVVGVSEDYDAYSPEFGYTEQMLESQGISKEKLDLFLKTCGYDLLIVPKNESLGAPSFEIDIRIKADKDYGIAQLKDLDSTEFQAYAEILTKGFALTGEVSYTAYENNNAKYIVFDVNITGWQRRYATIINGKMVYFIIRGAGQPISDEQDTIARSIIDTLQY